MYLWIGLGIENNLQQEIRNYCKEVNLDYYVSEQSFTLPLHISLKTSFETNHYKKIIEELKIKFSNSPKLKLKVEQIECIPGIIWLKIKENQELRKYHNEILNYLYCEYHIGKIGYDGDEFTFHSTLFQDEEHLESIEKLYHHLDYHILCDQEIFVDSIYFGISKISKVGTFMVIDMLELK